MTGSLIALFICVLGGCMLVASMPTTQRPQLDNIDDATRTAEQWSYGIHHFYTEFVANNSALDLISIQSNDVVKGFNNCIHTYLDNPEHNMETRLLTIVNFSSSFYESLEVEEEGTKIALLGLENTMVHFFESDSRVCNATVEPVPCFESAVEMVSRNSSEAFAIGCSLSILRTAADKVYMKLAHSPEELCIN